MKTKERKKLLGAITVSVMAFHLLCLYTIAGMEVTFQGLNRGNIHDYSAADEEGAALREEELAAIFEQMEPEAPQEVEVEFDYQSMGADFVMHSMEDLLELEELVDERQESLLKVDETLSFESPDLENELEPIDIPLEISFQGAAENLLDQNSLAHSLEAIELNEGNSSGGNVADAEMLEMMRSLGGGEGGTENLAGVAFGINQPGTIASSRDFDVSVEVAPAMDEEGFIFALQFTPKSGVKFKRVKHNMFFLIDRSHSIPKLRYQAFKEGVKKALSWMKPGDSFNVLVFDSSMVRLSESPLPWNQLNMEKAVEFLDAQPPGGMFATTDLYSSLDKIVPDEVADSEINTAILFSDGDTYLRQDSQRKSIAKWTKANRGRVSLYAVAAGENNNLALLEVLSSFNRGRTVYAEKKEQIERVLQGILVETRSPIGKDLMVTALPRDASTRISLYPRQARLPDLYDGVPYTILGTINKLSDFTIFLQGKFYDRRFDIKQTISLSEVSGDSEKLSRQIAVNRAFDHYEEFLNDGRVRHLTAAKRVLRRLKIPVAFQ